MVASSDLNFFQYIFIMCSFSECLQKQKNVMKCMCACALVGTFFFASPTVSTREAFTQDSFSRCWCRKLAHRWRKSPSNSPPRLRWHPKGRALARAKEAKRRRWGCDQRLYFITVLFVFPLQLFLPIFAWLLRYNWGIINLWVPKENGAHTHTYIHTHTHSQTHTHTHTHTQLTN